MSDTIHINLGSDLALSGVWRDENGVAMNMTGYVIDLFNAHPLLSDALINWTDASKGAFDLVCQHRSEWIKGRVMSFRVRVSVGSVDTSSPEVWVNVL